jgi:hypothetical protein
MCLAIGLKKRESLYPGRIAGTGKRDAPRVSSSADHHIDGWSNGAKAPWHEGGILFAIHQGMSSVATKVGGQELAEPIFEDNPQCFHEDTI